MAIQSLHVLDKTVGNVKLLKSAVFVFTIALIVGCNSSGVKATDAKLTAEVPLPKEIGQVQLDGTLKDFLLIRPRAKRFSLFGERNEDTNNPNQTLSENFQKPSFFDFGLYGFEASRLTAVALLAQKKEPMSNARNSFLRDMLKLYGKPDEIVVVQQNVAKLRYNSPTLVWRRKTALVTVAFTLDKMNGKVPTTNLLEYKAFWGNKIQVKNMFVLSKIKALESKKVIAGAEALLRKVNQKQ